MGEVSTWEPAGGPLGTAAGAGAGLGAAGAAAAAGAAPAPGAAAARAAARAASPGEAPSLAGCAAMLSLKPERSSSSPPRRWRATNSTSSLICSKLSIRPPPLAEEKATPRRRRRSAPAHALDRLSGKVRLERQAGAAQLEAGTSVARAVGEHQQEIVPLGDPAHHEGEAVGGDRHVAHLAHVELAVVTGDHPHLRDELGRQHLQV